MIKLTREDLVEAVKYLNKHTKDDYISIIEEPNCLQIRCADLDDKIMTISLYDTERSGALPNVNKTETLRWKK